MVTAVLSLVRISRDYLLPFPFPGKYMEKVFKWLSVTIVQSILITIKRYFIEHSLTRQF